jgi:uncharacterized Zn finger protein
MGYFGSYGGFAPYVSVAERKRKAAEHLKKLQKKGKQLNPIVIVGRLIAKTFWGKAWCDNLESYSDYENRLPRGRTYVRNGSVLDLNVSKGRVEAQVMGSSLYQIAIEIQPMPESKWKTLVKSCAGKIDSLIELLQGKFSKSVMEIITKKTDGLFPKPQEIKMSCSCPDYAGLCKHIAAVLYAVGASLDSNPERLFLLRHVNHVDLITIASTGQGLAQNEQNQNVLEEDELSAVFDIEMDDSKTVKSAPKKPKKILKKKTRKKTNRSKLKTKAKKKK